MPGEPLPDSTTDAGRGLTDLTTSLTSSDSNPVTTAASSPSPKGTGLTLLLRSRADTLRTRDVVYRRFVTPEPCARVGLAYRTPPAPPARHFLDLAVELQNSIEQ